MTTTLEAGKTARALASLVCGRGNGQSSSAPPCYLTNSLDIADVESLRSWANPFDQLGQQLTRPHLEEGSYTRGNHGLNRLLPLHGMSDLTN